LAVAPAVPVHRNVARCLVETENYPRVVQYCALWVSINHTDFSELTALSAPLRI
jgi:hypothetical protein